MPTVQITNPYGENTDSVVQQFPDFYTTSMMEDEVRQNYPDKLWPTQEIEKDHPPGVLSEFAEGFGDSWNQAQYDLAIGSAILRSDDGETFALLEEEYKKWKESPDDIKEYDILSGGFIGQTFGGVARDVVAGVGTGVLASAVTTPVGGLYTGAATVATLQGTTAKGGSMRNSYIAIRNEMEQKGEIDLDKAFETARRISNTDAMLAVGEAGLATLVPVARLVPGIGSSALSQAATKGAAELGFDATIGATGSVLSDVYAESEGVNRGDKFENALRAGLQEVIGGGIPSALRTYGEYKNIKMQQKTVADMLKEGEDVKRLPYTEFDDVPSTAPIPFGPTYRMDSELSTDVVPTAKKQTGFDWSQEDLEGSDWDFLEAPETRPINDPNEILKERLRQGNIEKGRKAAIVPVFDDEGNLVSMRKATRTEVEEMRKQGKNPVLVSDTLNKTFRQENGAGGRIIFREPGGRIFEMENDGTISNLTPTEWDPFLSSDGNILPFNEAVIPDQEIESGNLTWRDVLTYFPDELSKIENLEVMTGGIGGEIASVLKRELANDPKKQEAIFKTGQYGKLSEESVEKILDQNIPNDLDRIVKNRLISISAGTPNFKQQKYFETDTGKIAVPFSEFGHSLAGTKNSNLDLASQIGSQKRLDSLQTAIKSRIEQINKESKTELGPQEKDLLLTVPTKTGKGYKKTTISRVEKVIETAKKRRAETPKTQKKKIETFTNRINENTELLNELINNPEIRKNVLIPMPKNEHAILFGFLSDPLNPTVGPYPHDNDPAELTTELNGIKYLKDSNEIATLQELQSGIEGVKYDIKVSKFDTIQEGLYQGRITASDANLIANQELGLVQENSLSMELDVQDALASPNPINDADIVPLPLKKEIPMIDLEVFRKNAEKELLSRSSYGKQGTFSRSGNETTPQLVSFDDAVMDQTYGQAFFDDLIEIKNRLNEIEKFKWFRFNLQSKINENRKGKKINLLETIRPDLFNIDNINTIEDLKNRNRELETIAKTKYRSWSKIRRPLEDWLASQKIVNNAEVDKKAANYFVKKGILSKDNTIAEIGSKTKYLNPNEDNHFNKARRAARETLSALRNLGKLDGVLYSNGFVNFAAVGQLFKSLVKLGIALSAHGVDSVSSFAKAIRQSPDNEAVKTAWNDVQSGKVRTVESMSEKIIKGILELIKKRQISKAEQGQLSSMDEYVSAKWNNFLDTWDLQQYKDEGITPPIKALVKRYLLNEYVDLPHIMAKIAAKKPISTSEIEDIIKKIPDSKNAWYLLDGLETVMAEKGMNMDAFQDKFMQAMLDSKVDPKKFTDYLIAKHASERNEQIAKINPNEFGNPEVKGGSGMSNKKAREIIQNAKNENKQDSYEQLYSEYLKPVMDKTLATALKSGLIDQENYEKLRTFYKYYVPLRGKENSDNIMFATGNGIDVRGKEFKRALGRTSKTEIVIPYIFQQYNNMLLRAERAKVMQALAKFVQENPNDDITFATPDYVRKLQTNKGLDKVSWVRNPQWTNDTNLVGFKVEGKQYYLKFKNTSLAHSLRNQGVSSVGGMLRTIGIGTKSLSRLNTQYNVGFTLPNFVRDMLFAKINLTASGHSQMARDLANIWNLPGMPANMAGKKKGQVFMALAATSRAESPGVLGKTLTKFYSDGKTDSDWDAAYVEMKKYGGRIQFRGISDIETRMDDLDKLAKKVDKLNIVKDPKSKKAAVMAFGKGIKTFVEELNSSVESATRLATYKLARENGATPLQAAYLSRNITINFTKRGKAGAGLNNLFMFYNASAQGSYQVMSNLWHTKKGKDIAFNIAFTGFSTEILNHIFTGEDEDGVSYYEKIPEWKKATNFIIMNPVTGKDAIAIPLPYGYNAIHYMGQKALRVAKGSYLGSDKLPGTQNAFSAAADITNVAFDAFNPIGGSTSIARAITPDLGDVFIDLYSNKDWKGDKIMPEASPFDPYPKPDSQKYWSTVNPWIREFTSGLNTLTGGNTIESGLVDWSPETVETLLNHFGGGAGQTAFRFIDLVKPETWKDGVPSTNDWPVARRFVASPNSFYSLEKFKQVRALSERAVDTHEMYVQNRDRNSANEFKQKNEILFKINPYVKKTESTMRKINKLMRTVSASYNLSEEDKAIKLAKLKTQKLSAMTKTHSKFIELLETLD